MNDIQKPIHWDGAVLQALADEINAKFQKLPDAALDIVNYALFQNKVTPGDVSLSNIFGKHGLDGALEFLTQLAERGANADVLDLAAKRLEEAWHSAPEASEQTPALTP